MNRSINKLFEVYVFAFGFLLASRPISDGDFWFHLKTGEYIFGTGFVPRTEIFSFTNFDRPWIAHGWLSGAIFYAISSRLGFSFLIFLFAVLVVLAFWLTFRQCNSHPFIAGVATLLGFATVLPNIGVRPRVFTLLLSSIYLFLLTRYARGGKGRVIWVLIPLMLVWANLHGGFLVGITLIVLTLIGIVLDAWASGTDLPRMFPRIKELGVILLGSILIALVNPYGLRIYTFPIQVLSSPVFQESVVDWLSPNFHQPELMPLSLLILGTIAALALSPKRAKPSEVLFLVATLYATLQSNRNMTIFALVAVPIFAEYGQNWLDSTAVGNSLAKSKSSKRQWPVWTSLLLLAPLLAFVPKLKADVYAPLSQEKAKVPLKAVEFLKEKQSTGNTFTYPSIWGGYLIWALPTNPVYIDGRDVYPEQFVKEYLEIVNGITDWRPAFDRYGVRVAIVKPKTLIARELQESPDWQIVYRDAMADVYRRR